MPALAISALFGMLPVSMFLVALVYLDSYKLVRFRRIMWAIIAGGSAAALSYFVNRYLYENTAIPETLIPRLAAPVVEEALKGALIVILIRLRKIGFLVDAGIHGFAIGTGFALVENLYYLWALPDSTPLLWVIRGFGTAIMHGSTTGILAIITKALTDKVANVRVRSFVPGFTAGAAIHITYNNFFFSPILQTLFVLIVLPPIVFYVFSKSESYVRRWLGTGFDLDTELLKLLKSGDLSGSPIGLYLKSLREHFPGEVLADMICYLQLHTELSLRAKGLLMMRESGFDVRPDAEVLANLEELRYLDSSIGTTGKLAISPFLHTRSQDLWQLSLLKEG